MREPLPDSPEVWSKASPLQLLQLMKICGIESRIIANRLGVAPSSISMWLTGQRLVPPKYRTALLEWAKVSLIEARNRNVKEVAALPDDDLKRAAILEFEGPHNRWCLEVLYKAGALQRDCKESLRLLWEYVGKDLLTPVDYENIEIIARVLQNQANMLKAMGGEIQEAPTPQ